ncbi:hypothetical protein LAG90_12850 [Marinilongibacter aquaticus]|uniref:hypothetical protein n=1 Tax=Marinilongibacter aquaticus TaxID=2975157 RepID=UPI0021BD3E99|nr:hypothetical protein [Marinilongibacter aquaticus]UBM57701.1 hypothetical protein LAG90_12850 [Marinilongibacter aquaticus]
MTKRKIKLRIHFLCAVLLISGAKSFGQSIGYFPFNSLLTVSTNPEQVLWADFRFQTNSYFTSLSTEVAPIFNLNKNNKGRFYLGPGFTFNPFGFIEDADVNLFEGYSLNFGVRSAPLEKLPQLQFAFEVSPFAAQSFDYGIFRTRMGVAYNFSRHRKMKRQPH